VGLPCNFAKLLVEINFTSPPHHLYVNLVINFIYHDKKKSPKQSRASKFLNRAFSEVAGFEDLLIQFQRNMSVLGRSDKTFKYYAWHVTAIT
jgi:hypothetical protein